MSVANNAAPEHSNSSSPGNSRRGVGADLAGLIAILLTVIALVVLVGPAATTVLAAAGGFVAAALRLWLRRK